MGGGGGEETPGLAWPGLARSGDHEGGKGCESHTARTIARTRANMLYMMHLQDARQAFERNADHEHIYACIFVQVGGL